MHLGKDETHSPFAGSVKIYELVFTSKERIHVIVLLLPYFDEGEVCCYERV